MNLDAVRTFVAIADAGRFQRAADDLSITQQAVSKRVTALERDLGVRLFIRTPQGVRLTVDGQAFLPHARALLLAAERAADSVRPGRRALRVDVINRRIAPARLLRAFHSAHPEGELDVVTNLLDADSAIAAVLSGTIDATFRALTMPTRELPEGIESARVLDDRLQLLIGPGHPLAGVGAVTPAELARYKIWMPGIVPGTEWAAYYDELSAEFGLIIDTIGPNFGSDALLEAIAGSSTLATFVGEEDPLVGPAHHDLRRIEVRDPTPVYPHSLVWLGDNPHPALAMLRDHLRSTRPDRSDAAIWTPTWARERHPGRRASRV
ncbi:LysR family transcriptional regulator [Streptomyces sp. NPDC059999]|uniref:LysR family transcriptional regulator n=1 Tax=Streptomyces sp. NPDC059999 TaxID=3347030 RepID=UPI0036AA531F